VEKIGALGFGVEGRKNWNLSRLGNSSSILQGPQKVIDGKGGVVDLRRRSQMGSVQ